MLRKVKTPIVSTITLNTGRRQYLLEQEMERLVLKNYELYVEARHSMRYIVGVLKSKKLELETLREDRKRDTVITITKIRSHRLKYSASDLLRTISTLAAMEETVI